MPREPFRSAGASTERGCPMAARSSGEELRLAVDGPDDLAVVQRI
jgi:hypothetical protein